MYLSESTPIVTPEACIKIRVLPYYTLQQNAKLPVTCAITLATTKEWLKE